MNIPKARALFSAQTIRLEILQESSIQSRSEAMTTLKDEIFLLYKQLDGHYVIKVYNRDNMEEVKDVIPLPGTDAQLMTGCNVSNCVYISLRQGDSLSLEVLRISRDAEQKFNVSPWINDRRMMSVSANGSLIIYSRLGGRHRDVVRIYKANGSLQHEIKLPRDIRAWEYKNVIQKSNGNLVLAYVGIRDDHVTLTEVDLSGSAVRQFQSSIKHTEKSFVDVADESDRLMIGKPFEGIELLDSEFNLLGVYCLPNSDQRRRSLDHVDLRYDRNRNDIVRIHFDWSRHSVPLANVVTLFRFTE